MGFNVGNFVKDTAKTAVNRLVDGVVQQASGGLPSGIKSVAKTSAEALFNIGSSYESVSAFTSQKTDSVVSGADDEYFAMAGKNPARASKVDLKLLRRRSSEDTTTHVNEINPSTAIARKKADNTVEIISVI